MRIGALKAGIWIAGLWLTFAALPIAHAQDDVVMRAMRDELARSMQQLQLEKLEKPYFVAYRVQEKSAAEAGACFGALLSSSSQQTRFLTVEVRVGSHKLDNTNFLSLSFLNRGGLTGGFGGLSRLPLDDNYQELRRQLWLATDNAYKKALEDLSRKRAALQNKTSLEEIADFSDESPSTLVEAQAPAKIDLARLEAMARGLSGVLKESPTILTDSAYLVVEQTYTRYLNSEGTAFTRNTPTASALVLAGTQAADGAPLRDFVGAYGHTLDDLPSARDLEGRVREIGERLEKLRSAPALDRYNGPVLFTGQASAELFGQVIAPHLLATRHPLSDNPQFEMLSARMVNPFQDKLGGRVLPDFMSVVDDPTLTSYQDKPLLGAARVDDEGVRTRRSVLVQNGILKMLLATRNPVPGVKQSTGSRRGVAATPSNLLVTLDKGLREDEMKAHLLALAKQRGKPFGIVVERLANPLAAEPRDTVMSLLSSFLPGQGGEGAGTKTAIVAYKVFPDGHEELLRNVAIEGINADTFKDIVAASASPIVYSTPFISMGASVFSIFAGGAPAETQTPLVSFVVPSILFDDVTLKRPVGGIPKPPISPRPLGY